MMRQVCMDCRTQYGEKPIGRSLSEPHAIGQHFDGRVRIRATEHEILRLSAYLGGDDPIRALNTARNKSLSFAQKKTVGNLPSEAWKYETFDHLASGRDCSAVRLFSETEDLWVLRVSDPDKNVPGRVWTTEIGVLKRDGEEARFTLRLAVSSTEPILSIEPAVPGVVLELIRNPGLASGNFRVLTDKPVTIKTGEQADLLIEALLEPSRKLPIIVLSVASASFDPMKPALDATTLAKACAGLALVVVLPAQFSWNLTERFGKKLSVYEGAARVYLPGFTEDANPFGGHELLLPQSFSTSKDAVESLTRLRRIAASGSVRRLQLGPDVLMFAPTKARQKGSNHGTGT